jgi:hypothetical protein
MFERFARSWALLRASGTVLRQDKELLIFPVCSAVASLLIVVSFAAPLFASGAMERWGNAGEVPLEAMLLAFVFYLSQYFVVFFFNTALVGAAMIRLDGGDPTVADGLRIARSKFWTILGYAGIAATVGLILRMIEQRAGFIGRWIVGLLGVAFTVTTFLTVPILVSRDVGRVEAIKESASLLKKTWGENIVGNGGLALAFFLAYAALVGIAFPLVYFELQMNAPALAAGLAALAVSAAVLLALIQAALQGVYSAALYRYATDSHSNAAFPNPLLSSAFRRK